MSAGPLLEVNGVCVEYAGRSGRVRALDDVSLTVGKGETVGLVGESGAGKSTLGRAVLGLVRVSAGSLVYDGRDLAVQSRRQRRELTQSMQVVFQDPYSSLNPTQTVGQILAEPLQAHGIRSKEVLVSRLTSMLKQVGLSSDLVYRYPRQFSGGQRQRIAIARALILEPKFVVCDESLSALDLSVQAQITNLLMDLQDRMHLSYLFIAHDLAIVRHISHRVVVMNRGAIVEEGATADVYGQPKTPYTRELLAAAPVPDPAEQRRRRADRAAAEEEPIPARE